MSSAFYIKIKQLLIRTGQTQRVAVRYDRLRLGPPMQGFVQCLAEASLMPSSK